MTEIRLATSEDILFIQSAYQLLDHMMTDLYMKMTGTGSAADEAHSDEYWNQLVRGKTGFVLVALQDGLSVGIAVVEHMENDECHLEDLLVLPQFQQMGIGEKLIEKAKRVAKEKKYKVMSLNVLANNEAARQLYQKQDFDEIKISMRSKL